MKSKLSKEQFFVADCQKQEAINLVQEHHYAKGASKVAVYLHGLFRKEDEKLMGVAWWLPPTKPACVSVNAKQGKKVLSLSRLVVLPEVPANGASFLIGRSVRLIKQDNRFVSLVSYADTSQGHTGAIYRATNWSYLGETRPTPRWVDPATGKQVACKSTKNRTNQEMSDLGYVREGKYKKHKFVMHL
jgi:hypothetical protein